MVHAYDANAEDAGHEGVGRVASGLEDVRADAAADVALGRDGPEAGAGRGGGVGMVVRGGGENGLGGEKGREEGTEFAEGGHLGWWWS